MSRDSYWWKEAPLASEPQKTIDPTCDVVIVGAGYTGLSAAITLARAGRFVQIFDSARPGEGASTRNGGIASGNLRPNHAALVKRFGETGAEAIQQEAKLAREDLARFIAEEGIACDYALTGQFKGASAPGDYDAIARDADRLRTMLGIESHAVSRSEQRDYLGTNFYHGGAVRMDIGGLHPGKFHAGMLRVARASGVVVHGKTAVEDIQPAAKGFRVRTSRGEVQAGEVILGTNGYTDGVDPWLRRRMVPVRSRIIATMPLPDNLMKTLMPRRMMCAETRRLHYYFRPSPDGTRILFGGRDGTIASDPSWPSESLRRAMVDIFPELADIEIEQSWFGHVAMNRDNLPRVFSHRMKRYAVGYCGSGVVWARWAGQKVALQMLGDTKGASTLDFHPPTAVPLFNGTPWFMPAVFAWFAFRDQRSSRRKVT